MTTQDPNFENPNAPHTKLCDICMEMRETGFTMALYEKWRQYIGRRSAIETSIATLNANFDPSLLHKGICFGCSLTDYDGCQGIDVQEGDQ